MRTSCGIIPFRVNSDGVIEFFVAHPTNSGNYWAFCKGQMEGGESEKQTAIREFEEETGVSLSGIKEDDLAYLGKTQQSKKKNVVAFGLNYPNIDETKCHSNFLDDGVTPENDDFKWLTFNELKDITHKKHIKFYQTLIKKNELSSIFNLR